MVSVEPHLGDGGVFRHQVLEGVPVHGLVLRRGFPGNLDHPVPGREVDAQVHAILGTGVPDGLHDVRMVRTVRMSDVRRALRIVPQAESVVVLGGEDHFLEAVVARGLHPLVRVDDGGLVVLQQQSFRPGLPVAGRVLAVPAGEGGLSIVIEHEQFLALPGELSRGRDGAIGRRRARIGGSGRLRRNALTLHGDGTGVGEAAVFGRHGNDGAAGRDGFDLAAFLFHGGDVRMVRRPADAGVGGVLGRHAGAETEAVSHVHFQVGAGDIDAGDMDGLVLFSARFRLVLGRAGAGGREEEKDEPQPDEGAVNESFTEVCHSK